MAMGSSLTIKCPSLHCLQVVRGRFSSSRRQPQLPYIRASKGEAGPSSPSSKLTENQEQRSNVKLAPLRTSELTGYPRSADTPDIAYERLFSNLNEVNLQHEPGSLSSAIILIAGTTIGAGILAIPAVTQEAGFLASSFTCLVSWLYMVTTGLLIAEVNVNTMCELGSGGVSVVHVFP